MSITDTERDQGYWCAYHYVKKHGYQAAQEFADDVSYDDPWWQGYMTYLEEVM